MNKEELHLFILWSEARYKETDIVSDIENSFEIVAKYYIKWTEENAYKNFSRFYAIKSRYAKSKMKHCGTGEFVLIVVIDKEPNYVERRTNSGIELVNKNIFDKKELYRKWAGEGHKIHATNNTDEVKHNLALFFGVSYEDYYNSLDGNLIEKKLTEDLVGTNGWNSFEELFFVLNNTLTYCVLRNFEGFFEKMYSDEHLDIDILVRDYLEAKLVLSGTEVYPRTNRVANSVSVDGRLVNFDIRSVSDNYMPEIWNEKLLSNRICSENRFYRPNLEQYFYSLSYHAIVHKEQISQDYLDRFRYLSEILGITSFSSNKHTQLTLLKDYMQINEYPFVEPIDMSVYYNNKFLQIDCSNKRKFITLYRKFRAICKKLLKKIDDIIYD